MGEERLLAHDIISAGYAKAYLSDAALIDAKEYQAGTGSTEFSTRPARWARSTGSSRSSASERP